MAAAAARGVTLLGLWRSDEMFMQGGPLNRRDLTQRFFRLIVVEALLPRGPLCK